MKAEGSVEFWLNQLLNCSRASLHGIIRETFARIGETEAPIIEVLEDAPAQVRCAQILNLSVYGIKFCHHPSGWDSRNPNDMDTGLGGSIITS